MPRRQIVTERSRAALFDLPTDEPSLLRHSTSSRMPDGSARSGAHLLANAGLIVL